MSSRVCCPYCHSEDIFFEPYGEVRTDGEAKYRDTVGHCGYCGKYGDLLCVRVLVKPVKLEPTPPSPEELAELEDDE